MLSKNNMFSHLFLAILSGVLAWAAWPTSPLTVLIFVAFIPLLLVSAQTKSHARFFGLAWLSMLIWNSATTWWVWNASEAGAIGAILCNSILMVLPWMLYRIVQKKLGNIIGFISLISFWLTYEWLHHNWDLSWPWLTLGNIFSAHPEWVYWYSITGTPGGSLWVLLVNVLLANAIIHKPKNAFNQQKRLAIYLPGILILFIPIIISMTMKPDNTQGIKAEIIVVQPNVEPYTEKFTTPPNVLVANMLRLTNNLIDSNTNMVVWPETAIPAQIWENDDMVLHPQIATLIQWFKQYPSTMLVTGIDSYKAVAPTENKTGFSIRTTNNGLNYEAFNSALMLQNNIPFELYHKSKLVPGVESLPAWLGFLSSIFDSFGGISGTLGVSDSAIIFTNPKNIVKPAPVICYESIYGDYVAEYVRKGANIITVITNDGWWGNTPGYQQHMEMSRLRAIETHRWVSRSANTGISCFISPDGHIIQPLPWDEESAIKQEVYLNDELTFYAKHGDWLSRRAANIALIIAVYWVVMRIIRRKKQTT